MRRVASIEPLRSVALPSGHLHDPLDHRANAFDDDVAKLVWPGLKEGNTGAKGGRRTTAYRRRSAVYFEMVCSLALVVIRSERCSG